MVVGDRIIHRVEVREVMAPEIGGRGGKREHGAGPDEQPGGFEAAERGPRCSPSPTDEAGVRPVCMLGPGQSRSGIVEQSSPERQTRPGHPSIG